MVYNNNMVKAQELLYRRYPRIQKNIKDIRIDDENLEGKLIVEGYKELLNIDCSNNRNLTSVEIKNLPKLTRFNASKCQIKDIKIENCPNLNNFNVINNSLESVDFLDNLNPEKLEKLN